VPDFEQLEIAFPADPGEQERLTAEIEQARASQNRASAALRAALTAFSDVVDGRGDEELPEVEVALAEEDQASVKSWVAGPSPATTVEDNGAALLARLFEVGA
jgi:hypothetical protein